MTCSSACLLGSDEAAKAGFVAVVKAELRAKGYWLGEGPTKPAAARAAILALGRRLGTLYVPEGCPSEDPVIVTAPSRRRLAAPFDRPEAIGWHSDFASHVSRPDLSLVQVMRPDPAGGAAGAWRLVAVDQVVQEMERHVTGRQALALLRERPLPFAYISEEELRWLLVLAADDGGTDNMRFYAHSIRRGCISEYGEVPNEIELAIQSLEQAADNVCHKVSTASGSLFVADNWRALHDRARQSISRSRPNRQAFLAFAYRSSRACRPPA